MDYVVKVAAGADTVSIGTVPYDLPAGFELDLGGSIVWTALPPDIAGAVAPLTRLTGGYDRDDLVTFRETVRGLQLHVRIANRPELQEVLAVRLSVLKAAEQMRAAHWGKERAARVAAQQDRVPAGHVYLQFVGSAGDDWIETYRTPDGDELDNIALAGGQRATDGYGDWAYATSEAVAAARAAKAKRAAAKAEAAAVAEQSLATQRADMLAAVVPPEALAAFDLYRGNADRAWEREDETAWALIRPWGPTIKLQTAR